MANTKKKATTAKTTKAAVETKVKTIVENESVNTQADEIATLKAELDLLRQQLSEKPQVIQVTADTEKVKLRWQAEVADDNVLTVGLNGMYGQITGKVGKITVPKSEWSRICDSTMQYFLKERMMIVLSGLDEEERETYGVNYKESEILDQKAFEKLLDMGTELLTIYPSLCDSHREMIFKRFYSAYLDGDSRAKDKKLIEQLNETDERFTPLLELMNTKK